MKSGEYAKALHNTRLVAERIRVRQIVVVMQTRIHPVLTRESTQPMRHGQSVGANDALRSNRLGPFERRIDLRIGEAVAYVHVDRANGNPVVVKFLLDVAEVARRGVQPPVSQLLARLFRAHAGTSKIGLIPDRMQLDHAEAILHQPLDQNRTVLPIHRKIVIAEGLQTKLHTIDIRSIGLTRRLRHGASSSAQPSSERLPKQVCQNPAVSKS